jgi:large subunit ribosomal protein L3
MAIGLLGIKVGSTQIFGKDGKLIPVSVVLAEDNYVLQQKTLEKDGYVSTKLVCGHKRANLINKPLTGVLAKANLTEGRYIKEISFPEYKENELAKLEVGAAVSATVFAEGDIIDCTGTSKGKGTQGNIRRHHQSRGPETHGSRYHRIPGSMGPIKGKEKGKRLPGRMGAAKVTVQNLEVVKIIPENSVILVKGAIPGPNKGLVVLRSAVKKAK